MGGQFMPEAFGDMRTVSSADSEPRQSNPTALSWLGNRVRQLRQRVRHLLEDRRGNIAVVMGIALVPMVAAGAAASDTALAFMIKNRMAEALDSSALAAGRVIFSNHVEADARRFFDSNFPDGYLGSTVTNFDVHLDANRETITVTASASLPTHFMKFVGEQSLNISGKTVVHRQNRGAEISLVMDNTGSMRSGGKMDAMKSAATNLINILYGDEETRPNLWVAVVPYTATVNIGASRTDWLSGTDQVFDSPSPYAPTTWKGCVEARTAPHDEDDTPPNELPFTSYLYQADVDNVWVPIDDSNEAQNNGTGPNLGCGPEILPLTAEKSTVQARVDEMLPWHRGGTTGNLGLSWGWRTVSPKWRGRWGGSTPLNLPLDYGDPIVDKVVVILTDGQNQFYDWPGHPENGGVGPGGSDYTAYGRLNDFGYATLSAARNEIDSRFAATCEAMKAEGIKIFTITFGSTPDSATQSLYSNCASSPDKYFHSPTNEMLSEAFEQIGQQLSNLRIVE